MVVFLPGCSRSPCPHLPFLAQIFVETLLWARHAGPHTAGITKTARCKLCPPPALDGSASKVRHVQKDPKSKVSARLETNSGWFRAGEGWVGGGARSILSARVETWTHTLHSHCLGPSASIWAVWRLDFKNPTRGFRQRRFARS